MLFFTCTSRNEKEENFYGFESLSDLLDLLQRGRMNNNGIIFHNFYILIYD